MKRFNTYPKCFSNAAQDLAYNASYRANKINPSDTLEEHYYRACHLIDNSDVNTPAQLIADAKNWLHYQYTL